MICTPVEKKKSLCLPSSVVRDRRDMNFVSIGWKPHGQQHRSIQSTFTLNWSSGLGLLIFVPQLLKYTGLEDNSKAKIQPESIEGNT